MIDNHNTDSSAPVLSDEDRAALAFQAEEVRRYERSRAWHRSRRSMNSYTPWTLIPDEHAVLPDGSEEVE